MSRHRPLLLILLSAALVFGFYKVYASNFALKGGAGAYMTLGHYFDQDFRPNHGWTVFSSHGFEMADGKLAETERYFDTITLGDSFSFGYGVSGRETYWQDYLHQTTGLGNLVEHHSHNTKREVITATVSSPAFRTHPPRFVIYQTLETTLLNLAKLEPLPPPTMAEPQPGQPAECRTPAALSTHHYTLDRNGLRDARAAMGRLGMAFLRRAADYRAPIRSRTYVFEGRLTRGDLFSNPRRDILIYSNQLRPLGPDQVERIAAVLESYRQTVEANGVTRFVLAIVPMKENVFAPWLADGRPPLEAQLDRVRAALPFPSVDLRTALRTAIETGPPDIYLPGDEHTGPDGHAAIARAMYDFMIRQGWLKACA